MSAPRTVLAGLLLGALATSLVQGCDPACTQEGCPTPRLLPFRSGVYRPPGAPEVGAPGAETGLHFTLDAARARATERYLRDGRRVETEYEVVGVEAVDAWRSGTR